MNTRVAILTAVLAVVSSVYAANPPRKSENDSASISTPVVRSSAEADAMRIQGEQRFHMRVRATITDEDMRLILFCMTQ